MAGTRCGLETKAYTNSYPNIHRSTGKGPVAGGGSAYKKTSTSATSKELRASKNPVHELPKRPSPSHQERHRGVDIPPSCFSRAPQSPKRARTPFFFSVSCWRTYSPETLKFTNNIINNPIFPAGFADETLKTLSLLFPEAEYSKPVKRASWFQNLCDRESRRDNALVIDQRLNRCSNIRSEGRNLVEFRFWGPRLLVLKEAYDEATPSTILQWWHNRRNGVTWYTFWVAIWVFIVATFWVLFSVLRARCRSTRPTIRHQIQNRIVMNGREELLSGRVFSGARVQR